MLAQGLIDLGLCEGSLDTVLETGAYKQFYMHRAGHWLGLDVHDVGLYRVHGESRTLEPGMVLTMEPGIYLPKLGFGIRIEDQVLVTANGRRLLTAALPREPDEIERMMQGTETGAR